MNDLHRLGTFDKDSAKADSRVGAMKQYIEVVAVVTFCDNERFRFEGASAPLDQLRGVARGSSTSTSSTGLLEG
jgi:hypothetical protein